MFKLVFEFISRALFSGTRFVHTSEGKFLVTRLVPCPHCIASTLVSELDISGPSPGDSDAASKKILEGQSVEPFGLFDAEQSNGENWPVRKSQESYTSDVDSGVGPDSPGSRYLFISFSLNKSPPLLL